MTLHIHQSWASVGLQDKTRHSLGLVRNRRTLGDVVSPVRIFM